MSEKPVAELTIRPPSKDKPGYLRRQRELTGIQKRIREERSVEAFDAMIDYMLRETEVTVPPGVDAREALLDISEEQFDDIAAVLFGNSKTVDPQSAA